MKKIMFAACVMFLLPAVSFAGDKKLFDIADDMITLAEATISCAAQEEPCSEADLSVLQSDAVNGLREMAVFVSAVKFRGAMFSADNIATLHSRLALLHSRLTESGLFQTTCNFGIFLLGTAVELIFTGLYFLALNYSGWFFYLLSGLALFPVSCLVLLSCFFWWL